MENQYDADADSRYPEVYGALSMRSAYPGKRRRGINVRRKPPAPWNSAVSLWLAAIWPGRIFSMRLKTAGPQSRTRCFYQTRHWETL